MKLNGNHAIKRQHSSSLKVATLLKDLRGNSLKLLIAKYFVATMNQSTHIFLNKKLRSRLSTKLKFLNVSFVIYCYENNNLLYYCCN